jgi:hypothetical protein
MEPVTLHSAPGRLHVARGEAVPGGSLAFKFGRGDGFGELVGKPGLRAWVGLDRGTGRILSVSFPPRPVSSGLGVSTSPAGSGMAPDSQDRRQRAAITSFLAAGTCLRAQTYLPNVCWAASGPGRRSERLRRVAPT